MGRIKKILAIGIIVSAVTPSTGVFADTNDLVNSSMTKDEMINVANENNLNIKVDDESMKNLSSNELEKIVNETYARISTRKVDGETHVKKYTSSPIRLKDSSGKSTNASVYVTVVFDMYQDSTGKSITAIRSVTSDVNNGGIAGCKFVQDTYTPKSFSPTSRYTINGKGNLIRAGAQGQRVTFSLTIEPSDGRVWE